MDALFPIKKPDMQYSQYFLLLFFLFAASSLHAQRKFKKHFSYGVFYEQNRSFRILAKGNALEDWFKERQSTEKAITTAKFGANILFHLNEKWAIKSGFAMAEYGRLTEPTDIVIGYIPDTSMGPAAQLGIGIPITTPNVEGVQYRRKFAYFEVPLSTHYKIKSKYLSFFEFGLLFSKYRFETETQILIEEQIVNKYSFSNRKFNLGLEFLIGFNLLKTDFIAIYLSPSMSMQFLKKDRFHGLDEQFYSYGLRLQMDFNSKHK